MKLRTLPLATLLSLISLPWPAFAAPLTPAETTELVRLVDDRQRNSGDYTSLCYVKETEKKLEPKVFQAVVYRRDADNKFMIRNSFDQSVHLDIPQGTLAPKTENPE